MHAGILECLFNNSALHDITHVGELEAEHLAPLFVKVSQCLCHVGNTVVVCCVSCKDNRPQQYACDY